MIAPAACALSLIALLSSCHVLFLASLEPAAVNSLSFRILASLPKPCWPSQGAFTNSPVHELSAKAFRQQRLNQSRPENLKLGMHCFQKQLQIVLMVMEAAGGGNDSEGLCFIGYGSVDLGSARTPFR